MNGDQPGQEFHLCFNVWVFLSIPWQMIGCCYVTKVQPQYYGQTTARSNASSMVWAALVRFIGLLVAFSQRRQSVKC